MGDLWKTSFLDHVFKHAKHVEFSSPFLTPPQICRNELRVSRRPRKEPPKTRAPSVIHSFVRWRVTINAGCCNNNLAQKGTGWEGNQALLARGYPSTAFTHMRGWMQGAFYFLSPPPPCNCHRLDCGCCAEWHQLCSALLLSVPLHSPNHNSALAHHLDVLYTEISPPSPTHATFVLAHQTYRALNVFSLHCALHDSCPP